MKKYINISCVLIGFIVVFFTLACNNNSNNKTANTSDSTAINEIKDSLAKIDSTVIADSNSAIKKDVINDVNSKILIYNFHVTNRCPSCIAIEDATTKTLNTYFSKGLKEGRIKRQILNVDDKANKNISEKYEAFGSGLFITRVFKGKETTSDLTGDGFKFARNKEEKFIEILKNKISEYLK